MTDRIVLIFNNEELHNFSISLSYDDARKLRNYLIDELQKIDVENMKKLNPNIKIKYSGDLYD